MAETMDEEAFRQEALAFLERNAPRRAREGTAWGEGSDSVALFPERTGEQERAEVAAARHWRRRLFDAGLGWLSGPEAYGGRGLPSSYEGLWRSLEQGFATPSEAPLGVGLGMVAPTILAHAGERARQHYLRGIYRGDIVACQLFSEPEAGSDLAALRTRAVRDGEAWVVNGQKVWTSGAQYCDIGEVLCRTDPQVPKHRGLTAFVVGMRAPGVEVRPLRQMTGGSSFNEVFFSDVRVPDEDRLGDVNQGWTVALTTLMNERAAIGTGQADLAGWAGLGRLVDLLRHLGRQDDPVLRQQLADLYIHTQVASYTSQRALAKLSSGQLPGPELSAAKLCLIDNLRRVSELVTLALGPRLCADTGEWGTYAWSELVLGAPGLRLAGGTDEIMKNIIGERVLGLPKEPPPAAGRPTPGGP